MVNDYELVYLAQEYNEDAIEMLHIKYFSDIDKISRIYYKVSGGKGIDFSDIKQECILAFNYAIHSFNDKVNSSFHTFAKTCMENRLISLIRKHTNNKSQILNDSISLDYTSDEDSENFFNYVEDVELNPENMLLEEESYQYLYKRIVERLTYLEEIVLILKIQNFNYKEIALILDKNEKSIDNALQRIRGKVRNIL